jgi:catechol 2,3-dioxygenase-like lactoylglutathione lyase family enzyme
MQLGPLFEVIVYCVDIQAQVEFYRDTLGLKVAWPENLDDYSKEHWVMFGTEGATLALHSGGVDTSGTPARFGFLVADVEASRQALLDAGVRCNDVREAAPGILVVDCWDPETNPFFIEQRPQKY